MRLIDADALIGQYNKFALTAQTDYAEGVRDVINDINNAPTIEPKRGENLRKEYSSLFECSVCGAMCDDTYTFNCDINFCPNCGALMGEREGE